MDRITRKELKTDKFALEVGHTVDFFEEHRTQILRYGAIAIAVVLVVLALFFYRREQQIERQQVLANAIQVQEAPVGGAAPGTPLVFPTQEAKDQQATKAFGEVIAKYPGSDEAMIAEYYLGSIAADQGKLADAEKRFSKVAEGSDKNYASLAKLSLAQVYFIQGRADQGEKLLRSVMEHPTVFVSREQAAIVLARELAKTKPAEARKLLDPLRSSRSAVSQVAIQMYSELPQK